MSWVQRAKRYLGNTRSFTSFSQALNEVIDARVYSGIHFRTADVQGARIGERVAEYAQEHYFEQENDQRRDGEHVS